MTRHRVRVLTILAALVAAAGVVVIAATPIASNAWFAVTEPAYVIPAESSPWRFTPIQMNDGSGDWWVYGQDDRNYYYFTGSGEPPYVVFPKAQATDCRGFRRDDHRTWCR
ncbi:hypothetical protein [Mycobacterium sp. 852002-51961_SCH5331710]|uniref:hypothetical protein n=1 Tax=Mycobacterium sp. 852002-51961_SCH5331710 TaxID=1834105 RepID=UPI0008005324|nr:hypothetical protein [Mycobacterium sp. 852002-51961_SCH5331710]OBB48327.1 hypothetical protein A5752_21960 [Mycobacterium sp. 852002-51961_SCH5331710]